MTARRVEVAPALLKDIRPIRERYRRDMNCQIVHDSLHERGLTDLYAIRVEGEFAGYAAVVPADHRRQPGGAGPPDGSVRIDGASHPVIKEFYVLPEYRADALLMFRRLAAAADAWTVEAQTNDTLLMLMLFDASRSITSDTILFHDALTTTLMVPGSVFRMVTEADRVRMFAHTVEPVGDWLIESDGAIVATGGVMFHYNPPYGDVFMEVAAPFRRRGYGSVLVQELKRTCRAMGRTPGARCHVSNVASRKTLEKAGLLPCARILRGIMSAS